MRRILSLAAWSACALALCTSAQADPFGSGANSFEIEFVTIGNPGNLPDANSIPPGAYPNPVGAVPYSYRIGKYEISEQMIDKANDLGGGIKGDIPRLFGTSFALA
jgi:formylglycine-generating enzyme